MKKYVYIALKTYCVRQHFLFAIAIILALAKPSLRQIYLEFC